MPVGRTTRSSLALVASCAVHGLLAAVTLFAAPVLGLPRETGPGSLADQEGVLQLRGDQAARAAGRDRLYEVLSASDGVKVRLTSPDQVDQSVGLAWWSPSRGVWLAIDRAASVAGETVQVWRASAGESRTRVADVVLDDTGSGRVVATWPDPVGPEPDAQLILEVTGSRSPWLFARPAPFLRGGATVDDPR
jgi:hypothetical protein